MFLAAYDMVLGMERLDKLGPMVVGETIYVFWSEVRWPKYISLKWMYTQHIEGLLTRESTNYL